MQHMQQMDFMEGISTASELYLLLHISDTFIKVECLSNLTVGYVDRLLTIVLFSVYTGQWLFAGITCRTMIKSSISVVYRYRYR